MNIELDAGNTIIVIVIVIALFIMGGLVGHGITLEFNKQKAIDYGCGQFNPNSGEFEWTVPLNSVEGK